MTRKKVNMPQKRKWNREGEGSRPESARPVPPPFLTSVPKALEGEPIEPVSTVTFSDPIISFGRNTVRIVPPEHKALHDKLDAIEAKVDALTEKIDRIFGESVIVDGRFVDLVAYEKGKIDDGDKGK